MTRGPADATREGSRVTVGWASGVSTTLDAADLRHSKMSPAEYIASPPEGNEVDT